LCIGAMAGFFSAQKIFLSVPPPPEKKNPPKLCAPRLVFFSTRRARENRGVGVYGRNPRVKIGSLLPKKRYVNTAKHPLPAQFAPRPDQSRPTQSIFGPPSLFPPQTFNPFLFSPLKIPLRVPPPPPPPVRRGPNAPDSFPPPPPPPFSAPRPPPPPTLFSLSRLFSPPPPPPPPQSVFFPHTPVGGPKGNVFFPR